MQTDLNTPEEAAYSYQLTVNENSMECFRTLQCLIKENPFKNSNLDQIRLNNSRAQRFMVEGSSENEELQAVYLGNGTLVEASVVQRNIILPKKIYNTLATGELGHWTMIGNECIIKNFDETTKRYKVVLKLDHDVRVEYFDRNGERIQIIV
jgi:hypothetical protein